MVPGGTSESIAHFIGYLHLAEDPIRSHQAYDGGSRGTFSQPWSQSAHRDGVPDRSLDDLASQRVTLNYRPGDFHLIEVGKHKLLPAPPIGVPHPHLGPVPPFDAGPHEPGLPALDGFGIRYETVATPAPLPDQLLADLRQINVLHNDGVVLMATDASALTTLAALHNPEAVVPLPGLVAQAEASTPDWLAKGGQTASLISTVGLHDAASGTDAAPSTASAQPGLYTDGVLQPGGVSHPVAPTPIADQALSHNGMTDPGLEAHTGGNTAVNLASILDDHTQHTGLAVLGNVYTTDAIVQTNVLHSQADVMVGGQASTQTVLNDGNTAHNVASFTQHDGASSFVSASLPWAHLQVDTINGDFLDVKAFSQVNYVGNNDVVTQGTSSAFSEIQSGGNTQVNALPFSEIAQNYDLIVVEGSFHNTNAVVQQNVFLKRDLPG